MATKPLADRMRPQNFDEIAGQSHLVSKNGIIRKLVEGGRIPNITYKGGFVKIFHLKRRLKICLACFVK